MKKMLMVATVPSMIGQFNMNNIQLLQEMGYEVHVACDFTDRSVWTEERVVQFEKTLDEKCIQKYQIDFSRSALRIDRHIVSYKQLKKVVKQNDYKFIHCHTPIAGAISRVVCKLTGTKCIYTAHGFHFYKGAPLKNWLIFYPVEWICSWMTDVLITINKEDYNRAKKHLHAKKTEYVPGVGVDVEKFVPTQLGREKIRAELDLKDTDIMLLSVGELNENKNHSTVIKAISGMQNIIYVIVGKGENRNELERLAQERVVDVRLVGFRNDVVDFYNAADVYVLPSIREGLNVSLMEAMASGLPVSCGRIRGNTDLIKEENSLFDSRNTEQIRKAITYALDHRTKLGQKNLEVIRSFNHKTVENLLSQIYRWE